MKTFIDLVGEDSPLVPTLRFVADGGGTAWLLDDSFCDNLECDCVNARVRLVPPEGAGSPIAFELDRRAGKLIWAREPSALERAVTLEFAKGRRAMELVERHQQIVRASALAARDGPRIRREDRLYHFGDLVLRRENFLMPFEAGGVAWNAGDQYCANPVCSCTESVLGYYRVIDQGGRIDPEFSVRQALPTGPTRQYSGAPLTPAQERVHGAFLEALGSWSAELSLRRDLLRQAMRRRLQPAAPVRVPALVGAPASPRVRRNDPCPCGSGSKFKKCCGQAGA